MEIKPTAFFFHGTNICKIEDGAIKNVDKYYISTNNVYLVKEPVNLLAGPNDKTGNLNLNEGDMFLTYQLYGKDGWEYYRVKIYSEELMQYIIELEKRNAELEKRNVEQGLSNMTDCCCA